MTPERRAELRALIGGLLDGGNLEADPRFVHLHSANELVQALEAGLELLDALDDAEADAARLAELLRDAIEGAVTPEWWGRWNDVLRLHDKQVLEVERSPRTAEFNIDDIRTLLNPSRPRPIDVYTRVAARLAELDAENQP